MRVEIWSLAMRPVCLTKRKKERGINAGDTKWRCDVKSFGVTHMGQTLIISCNRCGRLFLASSGQKTRTCPYCGLRVDLRKAKKVASAQNAFEASEMLREIKRRNAFNNG